MAKRWYEGSCHCRAVTFAIHSEPIVGAMRCNCSICRRKGLVMSLEYYPPGAFELRTGTQALAIYHFDEKSVNHYFCKRCGVYPFHDGTQEPYRNNYRVNLGCIDEIDLERLSVRLFDGKDTWQYLS